MNAAVDDWAETSLGGKYLPRSPALTNIKLSDITRSLTKICRFNGHCRSFYSVGSHSIAVGDYVRTQTESKDTIMAAYLHDASEAYIGDMISPQKKDFPEFKELESKWEAAIFSAFWVDMRLIDHVLIKQADLMALKSETYNLMPSQGKTWRLAKIELPDVEVFRPAGVDNLTDGRYNLYDRIKEHNLGANQ